MNRHPTNRARAWSLGISLPGMALTGVLSLSPAVSQAAPTVYAESATVKVRPDAPVKTAPAISLTAARNEFVSFQVVVNGAEAGVTGVQATLDGLTGPGTINGTNITLFREAYLNITKLSGNQGKTGLWPDGLVPDTDEVAGEKRNAFPFDVPQGQSRAIWVDVLVPMDAPTGLYQGTVKVTGNNGFEQQVPVSLTVVGATLPSTPSLASAFLLDQGAVCQAHQAECANSDTRAALMGRYQQMALEHRVTLPNFYALPSSNDWSTFDRLFGPYLDGTAPSRLRGAKMTSAQFSGPKSTKDPAKLTLLAQHFQEKGWLDVAYDYTGDEPPHGIAFSTALKNANTVRSVSPRIRTLLTTNIDSARQYGLDGVIDLMTPVVNFLDDSSGSFKGDQSAKYDAWSLGAPERQLWLYQSCMSQGCGYGTNAPENKPGAGWPSYMVDRSGAKNRAMQWVDFLEHAKGELYYETALVLSSAWTDIFQFNGNGDGTLFYPGTVAKIGGKTAVPVSSIRLKLVRQGVQDYEWLKMVSDAGDPEFALKVARDLIPTAHNVGDDGEAFDQARLKLIARYQELKPAPQPPPVAETPPSSGATDGTSQTLPPGTAQGPGASPGIANPQDGQPSACGASVTGFSSGPLMMLGAALGPWLAARRRSKSRRSGQGR